MRQSTKVSYLSNKLFQAVISEPPFTERATHGNISINIITIAIVTITMTIIIITGVRLASVAYLIRHALATWNESIKKFLKMMEQRYQNLANDITSNNDDTCNTGKDICMLTDKDSVCTSKDITLGNARYTFHLFSYTNSYHYVIISNKAKRSGSMIDSYLTDKGNCNHYHCYCYHHSITPFIGISPSIKRLVLMDLMEIMINDIYTNYYDSDSEQGRHVTICTMLNFLKSCFDRDKTQ